MTRPLRFSLPWQPVEVTARTIQGRFLLKPSDRLNSLIAGIIAVGRQRYDVHVYNFVFLSNHFHLLAAAASPRDLSAFMGFVMGNIAREAGRLHDWQGPFWARRHQAIPVADDESLIGRMRYIFENGCKEGLVAHPARWPGLNAVEALTRGRRIEGIWVDRTAMHGADGIKHARLREADFTTRHQLTLDPLPLWKGLSTKRRQEQAVELVEAAAMAAPLSMNKSIARSTKDRIALLRPHHRPSKLKRSCAPLCHAATKKVADVFREAYRAFVTSYRRAAETLRVRLGRLGFPTHAQVLAFAVPESG